MKTILCSIDCTKNYFMLLHHLLYDRGHYHHYPYLYCLSIKPTYNINFYVLYDRVHNELYG